MKKRLALALFIVSVLAGAKKPSTPAVPVDAEGAYRQAMAWYEAKNYGRAIDALQKFIFNHPGSFYAGDAQFYLAESHYHKRDYNQAMVEYDFLIRNFTTGYREEAEFKYARCQYLTAPPYYKDQTQTVRAQELLVAFLEAHPGSPNAELARQTLAAVRERLARKEYATVKLYLAYDEVSAALVYIEYLTQVYPEADYTAQARFLLAQHYEKKKEQERAVELYRTLATGGSSVAARARERLAILEK